MRIKDGKGQRVERIYLAIGSVFTLALILYLVWLVRGLVAKSDSVFSFTGKNVADVPTFNFGDYERLMSPFTVGSVASSSTTASSTKR